MTEIRTEPKCLVRERIDVVGPPRASYMHKEWDDGLVQYYAIRDMGDAGEQWQTADTTEAEWAEIAKTHPPQATYPNSDWGAGFPGAGDHWKDIPAWKRGERALPDA